MHIDAKKTALIVRMKAELRARLRAQTWVQKVQAIERMNAVSKLARQAMARARAPSGPGDPRARAGGGRAQDAGAASGPVSPSTGTSARGPEQD